MGSLPERRGSLVSRGGGKTNSTVGGSASSRPGSALSMGEEARGGEGGQHQDHPARSRVRGGGSRRGSKKGAIKGGMKRGACDGSAGGGSCTFGGGGDGHEAMLIGGVYRHRIPSGPTPSAFELDDVDDAGSTMASPTTCGEQGIEIMTKKRMPLSIKLHTGTLTRNSMLYAQKRHRKIIKGVKSNNFSSEPAGREKYLRLRQDRGERLPGWDLPLAGKRMYSHSSLTLMHEAKKKHDRLIKQAMAGKRLGIPAAATPGKEPKVMGPGSAWQRRRKFLQEELKVCRRAEWLHAHGLDSSDEASETEAPAGPSPPPPPPPPGGGGGGGCGGGLGGGRQLGDH